MQHANWSNISGVMIGWSWIDINPIYVGLKRSCPGGSKNVLNVVVGLVDLFRLDFELWVGLPQ